MPSIDWEEINTGVPHDQRPDACRDPRSQLVLSDARAIADSCRLGEGAVPAGHRRGERQADRRADAVADDEDGVVEQPAVKYALFFLNDGGPADLPPLARRDRLRV